MQPPIIAAHTPSKHDPKQWHSLKEHLTEVARLCKKYAKKLNAEELGHYAGLWHDLGKYNPEFQQYLHDCDRAAVTKQKPPQRKIPHAIHGALLAEEICPELALIIDGHHRGLKDYFPAYDDRKLEIAEEKLDLILTVARQEGIEIEPDVDFDECFSHLPDELTREVFIRLLFSCLIDADRLDTEKFDNKDNAKLRSPAKPSIQNLWKIFDRQQQNFVERQRVKINSKTQKVFDIRQEVYNYCLTSANRSSGIFRLTVPTGGGKTLSSLAFALQHILANSVENLERRVIIAVPYTSIIEQTVKVYRDLFERDLGSNAVLEHHSGIQYDFKSQDRPADDEAEIDEGAIVSQRQARLATQNWDAPLVVTTTVQLFESLFSNRTSKCRKLHNIIGSVIILDEVQTLPIALREPICSMLAELVERYRVSIVLCTATQPVLQGNNGFFQGFDRDAITDIIPIDTTQQHFQQLKRVEYNLSAIHDRHQWSWQDLTARVNNHKSALVVLNTRKDALKTIENLGYSLTANLSTEPIAARVEAAIKNSKILHLSTLLCGIHRQRVLTEVRSRLENDRECILVSTQVVEAGVDLDFPYVYRALAPIDRIVQAAGRCNREGKMDELGEVFVFELAEGTLPPKGSEYAIATGKTCQILQQSSADDLHDPQIFNSYGNELYQLESADKKDIQSKRLKHYFETVANEFKLIDDDTYPIVIPYDLQVEELLEKIEHRGLYASDYRELQPYTVSVRSFDFRKHQKSIDRPIAGVHFYVWIGGYDPILGIPLFSDPADSFLLKVEDSVF